MAEVSVLTLSIDSDDDGQYWLSIENHLELGRKGPFDTQEAAARAATTFLQEVVAKMTKQALGV